MRIAIHSDLHIDKNFPDKPICRQSLISALDADVIILAGDISDDRELSFLYAKKVAELNSESQVIFVAGNHDYWNTDLIETDQYFRSSFAIVNNAHYLEHNLLVVKSGAETVIFYGSTYWSDFELNGRVEAAWLMMQCQQMPDFRVIKSSRDFFTTQQSRLLCKKSHAWLESELAQKHTAKKVVITHFPIAPAFNSTESKVSSWFANNHGALISKYKPSLVVSGHTHDNVDIDLPKTRMVSNQRGSPGEHSGYRPDLIIEI